jgi:O-antigen ligase
MNPSTFEASAAETGADGAAPSRSYAADKAVRAVYYAFMILIPIETLNLRGDKAGFSPSKLMGLVLFGLVLVNWRSSIRKLPAAFWLIAWYVAVYSFSQLGMPRALDARFRENQATLIQMVALFLISANLFMDAGFRQRLMRFFGWWISLVAVGMNFGYVGGKLAAMEGRATLLGQDPNGAAGLFAIGAICLAGALREFAAKRQVVRFALAVVGVFSLVIGILQTGSRGGLIDILAGVVALSVCGAKESRRARLLIVGAFIGLLAVLVVREFRQGTETATRLTDTWENGDTAGRTPIYDVAWEMFLERPLLGYGGTNNFTELGERLKFSNGPDYYRDTHNLLLAVLTEVGLVGGIPFFAAILYAVWSAWRFGRRRDDSVPFALMIALISINSSLTWDHQKMSWIVLGAAVACGLEMDRGEKAARSAAPEGLEAAPV